MEGHCPALLLILPSNIIPMFLLTGFVATITGVVKELHSMCTECNMCRTVCASVTRKHNFSHPYVPWLCPTPLLCHVLAMPHPLSCPTQTLGSDTPLDCSDTHPAWQAGTIFVMTHDSIGLGEDGPTHQPVEHLASFRAMPNILMMRPGDGNETAGCYKVTALFPLTPL